jgi:PPOX class probable F420-dependent enzyme
MDAVADELDFVRPQRHAVMITRRKDGSLQSSVVTAIAGRDRQIWAWSREGTAKTHNLTREPRASLCIVDGEWHSWMHVDATVDVVHLPVAMPLLEDYYRLRHEREHANWDDYRKQMMAENRLLLRLTPTRMFTPRR